MLLAFRERSTAVWEMDGMNHVYMIASEAFVNGVLTEISHIMENSRDNTQSGNDIEKKLWVD